MRISFFSALLAGLVVAGCGKPEAATPGNALAAPAAAASDARPAPAATTASADPARAAEPVPAAAAWREITLPAGTQLAVTLDTPVGSDTSDVEQPVAAHLTRPIHLKGQTVLAAGTRVYDYACAENNRNPTTAAGQTLTLGPDGKPLDRKID